MKVSLKQKLLSLLVLPVFAVGVAGVVVAPSVSAVGLKTGADSAKGDDQSPCLFSETEPGCKAGQTPIFKTITNVLLFIIGAISVIMLVIGGIRYTVSAGDSSAVTAAKNTIFYAIIGIVVAILAYAVVNFVIGAFVPGGDGV